MNRVKLIDGKLKQCPYTMYRNGRQVDRYNGAENEAMQIEDGWKLLAENKPDYDSATHYLVFDGYTEDTDNVYINYSVVQIPEQVPTTEEVLADVVQKLTEKGYL